MGVIEDSGQFIPTTNVWDVEELYATDVNSKAFKELLIRLYQNVANITQVINTKDVGIYDQREFVCGQLYFPNTDPIAGQPNEYRQVYRKVIDFGALPNAVPKAVAHNITNLTGFSVTRIYGASTDPTHKMYIPLPFISCKLGTIALWSTSTDIIIDCCGFDGTDYTTTYVVIEYLKL
jgi:hypothetical protein